MRQLLLAILLVLPFGCEDAAVTDMRAPEIEPWDALTAFQGEPLMSVAYPREMGNWGAVKGALTSPKFTEALSTFEQSPVPEAYSDKQAAKDAVVKAWKDAIEAAKSGPQDELKTKVEAAMNAMASL